MKTINTSAKLSETDSSEREDSGLIVAFTDLIFGKIASFLDAEKDVLLKLTAIFSR